MFDESLMFTDHLVVLRLPLDDHGLNLQLCFLDFSLTLNSELNGFSVCLCDGYTLCLDSGALSLLFK